MASGTNKHFAKFDDISLISGTNITYKYTFLLSGEKVSQEKT